MKKLFALIILTIIFVSCENVVTPANEFDGYVFDTIKVTPYGNGTIQFGDDSTTAVPTIYAIHTKDNSIQDEVFMVGEEASIEDVKNAFTENNGGEVTVIVISDPNLPDLNRMIVKVIKN